MAVPYNEEDVKLVRQVAAKYVEKGWCQQVAAMNLRGATVCSTSPEACRWCVIGAISRAAAECKRPESFQPVGVLQDMTVVAVMNQIEREWGSLTHWNDDKERTQEEVVALLRGQLV
jgi:hypothetical protein